jgi:hypothetical protein
MDMGRFAPLIALAVLAGSPLVSGTAQAAKARPKLQLSQCVALQPLGPGEIGTRTAVPVPKTITKELKNRVISTPERFVVQSQGGSAICLDMRRRVEVTNLAMDASKRFITFDWAGYEDEGHVIIDRSGTGQALDTGKRPAMSASRQRLASVHQSDSSYATLNGLGIWQVGQVGMQTLAVVELPEMADWRVDGWQGEECIDLSAIAFARMPASAAQLSSVSRDRFMAKPAGQGWRMTRTTQGCAGG